MTTQAKAEDIRIVPLMEAQDDPYVECRWENETRTCQWWKDVKWPTSGMPDTVEKLGERFWGHVHRDWMGEI